MTKKMGENKGGLSIFGTDFASRGLSWAGNLYHKWEGVCLDNIMVQDPSRFVDAISEEFRKFCEEVTDDWRNPFSDGCVKGPVSDLSLEQDVIADICKKSKTGRDESPVGEGSLISTSSEEDMSSVQLPVTGQDERKEACEILDKKITVAPAEVKRCNSASEIKEDHKEVSSNFVINPGSLSSADEVLRSEFSENIAERGFSLSDWPPPTEKNGTSPSEESICLIQSMANTCQEKSGSPEPEVPLLITEVADTNVMEYEEFEDVKLADIFEEKVRVDYWGDAEKYELALISHRAMKNRSYKKKLKDIFNSNFHSLKKKKSSNNTADLSSAIDVDVARKERTADSSVSGRCSENRDLSITESCEPDWEIL